MEITLTKAIKKDIQEIYNMQIKSFSALLKKYQDYDFSPGAEKIKKTIQRFDDPFTDYYFICKNNIHIGALRICNYDKLIMLKQIFILPEYQGNGYA